MRLFFGIYPDKATLDFCRDVYREFDKEKRNLRQVPIDQLHVTLRFVGGKVSDKSKNMIIEKLRTMQGSFPKPEIKIKRVLFGFPKQYDPRALFAEIVPNPEILELQDRLSKTIRSFKFKDTIRWKTQMDKSFHITIARLKPAATRSTGRDVKAIRDELTMERPEGYIAHEMFAIQSIINSRQKPVYKTLERIQL